MHPQSRPADATTQDAGLPGEFVCEFLGEVGGKMDTQVGNVPWLCCSFDARWFVPVTCRKVLRGALPYGIKDRLALKIHSPTKTFVRFSGFNTFKPSTYRGLQGRFVLSKHLKEDGTVRLWNVEVYPLDWRKPAPGEPREGASSRVDTTQK